jgi:hypothetical protein
MNSAREIPKNKIGNPEISGLPTLPCARLDLYVR